MTQAEKDKIIKELQEKLAEAEKIEVDDPKRWKPEFDEEYHYVDNDGRVEDAVCASSMRNRSSFECWCRLTGNCFKTKKEAEEYKKQIEYTARYKNYIEEHSEPIDWNDTSTHKHLAEFCYDSNKIVVECFYSYRNQGAIYASSGQIIWDAIKEIGEDNFKKYVLGVK